MNDFESALAQQLNSDGSASTAAALRTPILQQVERELRSRRRDRLLTRIVAAGLLLGVLGNFATNYHERARMARWFPHAAAPQQTLLREDTVFVQVEKRDPPGHPRAFEEYLLAWYSASDQLAGDHSAARATAAWIDEYTRTGRGL